MKHILNYLFIAVLLSCSVIAGSPVGDIVMQEGQSSITLEVTAVYKPFNWTAFGEVNNVQTSINGVSFNASGFYNSDLQGVGYFKAVSSNIPDLLIEGRLAHVDSVCLFSDVTASDLSGVRVVINSSTLAVVPCTIDGLLNLSLDEVNYLPFNPLFIIDGVEHGLDVLAWDFENFSITLPFSAGVHSVMLKNYGPVQEWTFNVVETLPVEEPFMEVKKKTSKGGGGAAPFYAADKKKAAHNVTIFEEVEETSIPRVESTPTVVDTSVLEKGEEPVISPRSSGPSLFHKVLIGIFLGVIFIFMWVVIGGFYEEKKEEKRK